MTRTKTISSIILWFNSVAEDMFYDDPPERDRKVIHRREGNLFEQRLDFYDKSRTYV